MKMELHLLMASNDGYVPYMGISLFSMWGNNAKGFDWIHICGIYTGQAVAELTAAK